MNSVKILLLVLTSAVGCGINTVAIRDENVKIEVERLKDGQYQFNLQFSERIEL